MAVENQESRYTEAVNAYINTVFGTGLVDRIMFGTDEQEGSARILNVFSREVELEDSADPQFVDLTSAGATLARLLSPVVTRVSYINPSMAEQAIGRYKNRGIEFTEIELPQQSTPR